MPRSVAAEKVGAPRIAVVHDFLVDYGGAERVALAIHGAFPGARLYTLLYARDSTFAEYRVLDVRQLLGREWGWFTRHHRFVLPFVAGRLDRTTIDADVVVCSSSGWAHGVRTSGAKIVYCYTPARWLYEPAQYLGDRSPAWKRAALKVLTPRLVKWDQAAAKSASSYLTSSSAIQSRIRRVYDREARIVPPPVSLLPGGPTEPIKGTEPGFLLCVARLLPYKKVDVLLEAMRLMPNERLVVAGHGPLERSLRWLAPSNATLLGRVPESQLRWLYANCFAVLGAAYEDYGLSPLEGAMFGRPGVVLRWGGYLDTVRDGTTGTFFDEPSPAAIANAVHEARTRSWDNNQIRQHASAFSEASFQEDLRQEVLKFS